MACCEWGCGPQPDHGNGRRIIAARLARNIMRFAANTTGAGASRLGADRETASNLGSVGGTRLLAWQGKAAEAPTCTASCTVQNVASKQPYCGGPCALAYTLLLQSRQSSARAQPIPTSSIPSTSRPRHSST